MANEENAAPEEGKAPEGDAAAAPAKKKFKLGALQIALVGQTLLVFAAAAIIAKVSLSPPKHDLSTETLKEKAIVSVKEDLSKVEMVELDEFVVNVTAAHTLKAKIQLEVSDREVSQQLNMRKPAVRARIMDLLSGLNFEKTERFEGKLLLKDAIRDSLNQELRAEAHDQLRAPASHGTEHEPKLDGIVREIYFIDFILI